MTACVVDMTFDPNDSISRTSLRNVRQIFQKILQVSQKSKFIDLNLKFGIVHWDS